MKIVPTRWRSAATMALVLWAGAGIAEPTPPPFSGSSLPPGWVWLRENPDGWRLRDGGLEILIEPGNMWGGQNNARNVLLSPRVEEVAKTGVQAEATLAHTPSRRWEQADLVWYYDDSHMVKIGLELEHGTNSVVMGREASDRTRTIRIVPIDRNQVTVRLTLSDGKVHGAYRMNKGEAWIPVGACEDPKPPDASAWPRFSIQCYQGDNDQPRWARITELQIGPTRPDR